ncbi:hypothetical protein P153DRAFT_284546 [Dothidotthia symphoricarpi CBS 119687]|uniref:Uncharacterized protein n=1 Tax=Dothidotthia symphoricarpi CBS 119687 TaxID=1392245 RepID=A0A6A6AM60_9PLEO|nr:uncharacterized protein P153DRAFT_284546 [Dothidotthia symphoricarpi CBS 119687]KAF2131967.1 hypothetical protein P153DRAFT_284546 [Dothidotthia symphoricarpi CBS 119687]
MDATTLFRQLLRTPACHRYVMLPPLRPHARTFALLAPPSLAHPRFLSLPRVLQPSFWASMVPKPFKTRSEQSPRRGWNPATPYIILSLLVGSQAIQILWLKQERSHTIRRAETKIGMLKEVIERVQRGEHVEVEKELGTGDAEGEREWAEVVKDIQDEEALFQSKKRRKALRQAAAKEADTTTSEDIKPRQQVVVGKNGNFQVESIGGSKFY